MISPQQHRQNMLRNSFLARIERGELKKPIIDPQDNQSVAKLKGDDLQMVRLGVYELLEVGSDGDDN